MPLSQTLCSEMAVWEGTGGHGRGCVTLRIAGLTMVLQPALAMRAVWQCFPSAQHGMFIPTHLKKHPKNKAPFPRCIPWGLHYASTYGCPQHLYFHGVQVRNSHPISMAQVRNTWGARRASSILLHVPKCPLSSCVPKPDHFTPSPVWGREGPQRRVTLSIPVCGSWPSIRV